MICIANFVVVFSADNFIEHKSVIFEECFKALKIILPWKKELRLRTRIRMQITFSMSNPISFVTNSVVIHFKFLNRFISVKLHIIDKSLTVVWQREKVRNSSPKSLKTSTYLFQNVFLDNQLWPQDLKLTFSCGSRTTVRPWWHSQQCISFVKMCIECKYNLTWDIFFIIRWLW